MPFRFPLRPALATALLLIGVATAQSPASPDALPGFAGHDAAWWDEQLKNDLAAREQLAVGAAEALPLLRWLLENGNQYARYSATAALTRLGPAARPFRQLLLDRLRAAESAWPDGECAAALAAIGGDRDDLRQLLLQRVTRSPDAPLRAACGAALATLRSDAATLLLGAVAQGSFVDDAWAIDVLTGLGEQVVPALLAELDAEGQRGRVAREAMVRLGWTVAARLDQAGHAALAQRALSEGLLRGVQGCDQYDRLPLEPEPPSQHLPALEATLGSGHGHNLQVWRGAEGARGFVIRRVKVVSTYDDERQQMEWHLSCDEATVPRELALGMTRQLRVLARLELQLRSEQTETWWSSGNFAASVRLETQGDTWLDTHFVGYPRGSNVPERYRPEAASHVLYRLASLTDWRDSTPDEHDRAAVARQKRAFGAGGWLGERFAALEDLLPR